VGFKAEFGDEVGEELVEDFFSGVEGLGDVSMGVEEVLDC
jgi:hypothetical protein